MRKLLAELSLVALLGILIVVGANSSGKAYPDCNNNAAKQELSKLYDNQRLLRAASVGVGRLVKDRLKGRYCAATMTWSDGSKSDVSYAFYRSGPHSRSLSMWIDYNGGMNAQILF